MVYITPSNKGIDTGDSPWRNEADCKRFSLVERLWFLLGIVNHAFTVAITIYISYYALEKKVGLYELHIALPTIGYQFLMAQTILTFTGENLWSYFLDRNTKKAIHWALGATGSTLAVAGTSLMIYHKTSHFTSIHGILGFIAMLFVLTTFINGPMAYFATKIKFIRAVYVKMNHYVMGTIGFVIGMSSLILGFQKNWFISRTSPEISVAVTVLSSLTIIITMRSALFNMFHVTKRILSN